MTPALTVLQLDTAFPRIPGDIGCADTFRAPVEIVQIPGAAVARVVTDQPQTIDVTPFTAAARAAKGAVVTTSCGFLAPLQAEIAKACPGPFISSALLALDTLGLTPDQVVICTFDPGKLGPQHLPRAPQFAPSIVGLAPDAHLRAVIEGDLPRLDAGRARAELVETLRTHIKPSTRHILLECTNMPPYKRAIEKAFGLKTTDILDLIEAARPGTVEPDFLSGL